MTFSAKIAAASFAAGLTFSISSFAASNVWDSASPWEGALISQYAAWDNFTSPIHNFTPEYGTGATLTETSTNAALTGTKNIYNAFGVSNFIATLLGSPTVTGTFDVYLRAATTGTLLNTEATLNGVSASSVETFLLSGRGVEQEVYWKWSDVSAAGIYVFNFGAAETHLSLDQLALAVVTAVPEPSTYAMLALGLGVLGAASRRRKQK